MNSDVNWNALKWMFLDNNGKILFTLVLEDAASSLV